MYLLFDIGGTKMRVTVSQDGQAFGGPKIVMTPQKFDEGMEQLKLLIHELVGNQKITAAAGGLAGPLNREKSKLVNAPHLPDWIGQPFQEELEKMVNGPVYLENDTALVGLGEATVGAGRNHNIVVYITVSTGVGGVRIVNGQIDRNTMGFEPGHQIILFKASAENSMADSSHLSSNINYQTLENFVSGQAVEKRFGKKPFEITDQKIWNELARLLAIGLNNTIVHWSPDVIVLGGAMIVKETGISLDRVEYHLKKILTVFPNQPRIKKAELGDVGGLHGARTYLRQKLS